jgi:deoxyuridine 5'-triphosphate nucleotidohydrolase
MYESTETRWLIRDANLPLDGRIAPRSGLASKNFIDTGAGVIDADYRGQVKVLLFNHAETDFKIKTGDRIAQLVLERVCMQILDALGRHSPRLAG